MVSQRAIELIAEARIEQAMKDGELDNLPGFGRPFEFDPITVCDNWWLRQKIEREELQKLVTNGFCYRSTGT